MAGYTQLEQDIIKNGAEEALMNITLDALCKDEIGCTSDRNWRIAWNIDQILYVLGRSLTEEEETCLFERLIDYKNKPLD